MAFYTDKGEPDHIDFAKQALSFFTELGKKNDFHFEATTHWEDLNAEKLKNIQLVIWLNDFPKTPEQRAAFENYMTHGGAWLGFHVSAYNDDSTHWPWFVDFLGGAVFYGNNWPPLPAKLVVDDRAHPVTRDLPAGKRVVHLEAQPPPQQGRKSPAHSRSLELSDWPQGQHHRRRPSRCLDQYALPHALREHGPRRQNFHQLRSKQTF